MRDLLRWILNRPLSGVSVLPAGAAIAYEIVQISPRELYEKPLGGVDRTTLIQLGILALRGLLSLRERSDWEAASCTLVNGRSFRSSSATAKRTCSID